MKKKYILALVIFVLLPLFFPCGGRWYHLFPVVDSLFSSGDGSIFWGLIYLSLIFSVPYWIFVGNRFYVAGIKPLKSFLLGNLPIFFDFAAETLYYLFWGNPYKLTDYDFVLYLIGAHIDKFQPVMNESYFTVPLSAAAFLLAFEVGYYLQTIDGFLSCQKTS